MKEHKKFIVITSIFPPTEAVKKFANIPGWQLIVVGDKKTPDDWRHDRVVYLSPDDQIKQGFSLVKDLPWNHYCRKMVGYLYAIKEGAEYIADADDDNLPLADWPAIPAKNTLDTLSDSKFVNIYENYTEEFVWPRGFPLNRILSSDKPSVRKSSQNVAVWQFLANEDPDVDAIYRLTINKPIVFQKKEPVILDAGTVCPFNSQNTIFRKQAFPLLYLPAFVTFRFTDILRGFVAQPLLWQAGLRLGFGHATVVQERNPHDYLKDFESEVPVYVHGEEAVDIATAAVENGSSKPMAPLLLAIYRNLRKRGIVSDAEVKLLQAWVSDLDKLLKIA